MTSEQLQQIRDLEWDDLYRKLEAFSLSLAKLYFKTNYKNLPKGNTYEDIVQRAIRLSIDRDWTEFSLIKYESYLFGAIKSRYWGLAISEENKTTKSLNHKYDKTSDFESVNGDRTVLSRLSEDIHDQIQVKEVFEFIEFEISQKENAENLATVLECIKEGHDPQEIATRTGLSLGKVTNCKRQLLRIVDKISKSFNDV